jgi:DNA-binding transcriptional ArsR family regulator
MEDQKDKMKDSNTTQGQREDRTSRRADGFGFLSRKAEKLTTALYMVTDILSDKEPMKWSAREAGVSVLSDITFASGASPSERMSTLRAVLKKVERVVSFLDIASGTRMISEMNANVLKKEYLALKDAIEAEWSNIHDRARPMFSERFFEVERELPSPAHVAFQPERTSVAFTPRHEPTLTRYTPQTPTRSTEKLPVTSRPTLPITPPVAISEVRAPESHPAEPRPRPEPRQLAERDLSGSARTDFGRDDRRKIIFALLNQKPSVTVGDIGKSIPGVSEKTIQRELLAMVGEGILTKHGERRWSTYALRTSVTTI